MLRLVNFRPQESEIVLLKKKRSRRTNGNAENAEKYSPVKKLVLKKIVP